VFTRQLCGSTGAGGRGDESSHRWEFVPQAEAEDRKPLRARDLSPQPGPYLSLFSARRKVRWRTFGYSLARALIARPDDRGKLISRIIPTVLVA
jgi:hypothetical protein